MNTIGLEKAIDTDFLRELQKFGPEQTIRPGLTDANFYCKQLATSHYENFSVVSLLVPRQLRQDFYNIYAFCRWSDDLADEIQDPELSLSLLQWWREELDRCYAAGAVHPVLIALQQTVQTHSLPKELFESLLSAFVQDQTVYRYADDAQLLDYCSRSANPVGRLLLHLGRTTEAPATDLSDSICTGLQLANFCQDISRDAAIGRIYAPRSLWAQHGVTEHMLLARKATPEMQNMLRQWVAETRGYFHAGWPLIGLVPRWLQTDVDLFVRGGLQILAQIAASNYDVWTRRPIVSKWSKLRLLASSMVRGWIGLGGTPNFAA